MSHKITPEAMFADVARTTAAAKARGIALDWNEPKPAEPFHCPSGIANCSGAAFPGHVAHAAGDPAWTVVSPGWNWRFGDWSIDRRVTDDGTEFVVFLGTSAQEITTDVYAAKRFVAAEIRKKIEALDAELRRDDLDSSIRATLIAERSALAEPRDR